MSRPKPDANLTTDEVVALDTAAAAAVAVRIEDRWTDYIRGQIQISPRSAHYASSLGEPCDRRLYHDLVDWESARPVDEGLQTIFERGRQMERVVLRLLDNLEVPIVRTQERWADERLRVHAKIDGFLHDPKTGRDIPAEIKSTMVPGIANAHSVEDLKRSRYGRKYYAQVQMYLYLFNTGAAVFIVLDVQKFRIRSFEVPLDWDFADRMVKRIDMINAQIDARKPPEYTQDTSLCPRCPHFGRSCFPPVKMGEGITLLKDEMAEEIIEAMRICEATVGAKDRYTAAWKEVKERCKGLGLAVVAGDYQITNKPGVKTTLELPADLRKKYTKRVEGGRIVTTWQKLGKDGAAT